MVSEKVLRYFVIACQHLENAKFAGSPRHAIAEGYSAVDSCFAALLVAAGREPDRNHKRKLDSIKILHPRLLDGYREKTPNGGTLFVSGVPWSRIDAFYQDWLQARYAEFSAGPTGVRVRCVEAHRVFNFAIRAVANEHTIPALELEDRVRTLAFGYLFSETDVATSDVSERRCEQAERYGEMRGAPIGTRLAETSNYCALAIQANDPLTQQVIEKDALIAEECSEIYERFIRLIEHIQDERRLRLSATGPAGPDQPEPIDTPNFMLALRMSFHGNRIGELANEWSQLFSFTAKSIVEALGVQREDRSDS